MIRALHHTIQKLLLISAVMLMCFGMGQAMASVETYVDEALPTSTEPAAGQPLNAGDLTMQDLLAKKRLQPITKTQIPTGTTKTDLAPISPVVPVPTPKISAPVKGNSAGTMLLQGMQGALGEPVTTVSPTVVAPVDRAAATVTSAEAKPIANGVSAAPLPVLGNKAKTTGSCTPQTSSWTKTCAEAGYPDTYVGQIRGETRTSCPEGTLQDVWISNGCVPPDNAASTPATTALTSPTTSTPSTASVTTSSNGEPLDASCGAANGLAANAHPLYDLCAVGTASAVSGEGPWRWTCQGVAGGMTVSCAAPVAIAPPAAATQNQSASAPKMEDAQCGSSDGVVADNAPFSGLCAKGIASRVNGNGPWTWACSGSNGGRAAACGAPKKIDGVCGVASGTGTDQMPMSDLCVAGYASAVTGNGPWAWTCSGLNGGQAATCSAAPKLNAVCGPASLVGSTTTPKNALCSVGQASTVNGNGPWSWTCAGTNGGASVSCESHLSQNGTCGLSHGTSVSEAPSENLCASGKASRVAGNGPWSWTCSGLDGGDTSSCTATRASERTPVPVPPVATAKPAANDDTAPAPMAAPTSAVDTANLCGTASELVAIEAPKKNLCRGGTAGAVIGRGPWVWTCTDRGQQSSCSTLSLSSAGNETSAPYVAPAPVVDTQTATCGSVSGQGLTSEPSSDLCSNGKASAVTGHGPWTWYCAKGKSRVACQAAKIADGVCGPTNGSVQKYSPMTGLCASGNPTQVQGNGPWIWSCVGTGGGSSISCSATSQSQTRVDGSCGASNTMALTATPAANLCDSGVASAVYGEGPWTWTCSGLNGGIAASCSAGRNTPPAPPPPGPTVNSLCGAANGVAMIVQPLDNLCSTGTTTSVSGNGPWNWNCIGENGGMTVSCTAPLQPPAPISGVCGAANGVPTLTTPKSGLCSGGISSAVSGKGPWTWSCSGVNGGSAVGCVAPLAGGEVGSLPSMTTTLAANEDVPAPRAAPSAPVMKKGLVTPRMPSGSLPPLRTGNLPPAPNAPMMSAPAEAPQLSDSMESVTPPPVRDTLQPSPALKSDESGNVLPGNHFVLDSELSTISFAHSSDNYDPSVVPNLNKLVDVMSQNSSVRITLTAYADVNGTSPREARRLSLSRALAIRDYLTSKGISSSRIDVRALGANVASGPYDRVDVKAN